MSSEVADLGAELAETRLDDNDQRNKRKVEKLVEKVASSEEESEDLKYAREEVALCPRNAQCRLDLSLALEKAGLLRFAHAEARAATTLTPKYGRAWKARSRLETLLSREIDDDDGPYLQTPLDEASSVVAEAEVTAASPEEASALSLSQKAAGNEHFVAKRHAEAVKAWTAAIELLKLWSLPVDAKLYSNRAAAYLQLHKNVLAVADARLSAEADPEWWKAHWYLGQALSAQLVVSASQRGACTSNGERAQEAYRAISACADCATLPAQKRPEVEAYKDKMQSKIYEMTDQGACAIM